MVNSLGQPSLRNQTKWRIGAGRSEPLTRPKCKLSGERIDSKVPGKFWRRELLISSLSSRNIYAQFGSSAPVPCSTFFCCSAGSA